MNYTTLNALHYDFWSLLIDDNDDGSDDMALKMASFTINFSELAWYLEPKITC